MFCAYVTMFIPYSRGRERETLCFQGLCGCKRMVLNLCWVLVTRGVAVIDLCYSL